MAMRITAAILLTCFYGAFFYKLLQLRRHGIAGNRMGRGRKPASAMVTEILMTLAVFATAVMQYASVFWLTRMVPITLPAFVRLLGFSAMTSGVIFFVRATMDMRDSWRVGVDETQKTSMITHGVYSISRNPAYVGFDFLFVGAVLSLPNVILAVCSAMVILLLHLQILEEERMLPYVFGHAYTQYKAKTPRYLFTWPQRTTK